MIGALVYTVLLVSFILWMLSRAQERARLRLSEREAAEPIRDTRPVMLSRGFPPAETVDFDALTFAGLKARKWNVATSTDPHGRTHHVVTVPGEGRCVYRIIGPYGFGDDDRAVYRGHRIA